MKRRNRGLTLTEAAVVLAVLAAASLVTLAALRPSSAGSGARRAQGTAEQAIQAVLDARWDTGTLTADPVVLAGYDPAPTFLASADVSTGPQEVSVAVDDTSGVVAAAVADGDGTCWMRLARLSPTAGQAPSLMVATTTLECSGATAAGLAGSTPPTGTGSSWSRPWMVDA